jgi:hypothetical protein
MDIEAVMLVLNWPWISVVMPGLDPDIHLSSEDGLPGQARQ